MDNTISKTPVRIHPHKFTLWVAMASIVMMFAGLTSAYIVKKSQSNWLNFDLPIAFWYSTFVILISSITLHLSQKAFLAREMARYRLLITISAFLGLAFVALQLIGFSILQEKGINLIGGNSNPASSFLFVITGLHILHVLGGVIALLVMFFKANYSKTKVYSKIPIEIVSTYWHFVDLLWVYLFVFFNWMH
jgi:cytochrome c oxidase subunit 3